VGPPILKEALDTFYIEVMGRMCYSKFFDANIFRAGYTSFQQNLNKNNQADFFLNCERVENTIRANVKLKK
jgi:hypothetical protein